MCIRDRCVDVGFGEIAPLTQLKNGFCTVCGCGFRWDYTADSVGRRILHCEMCIRDSTRTTRLHLWRSTHNEPGSPRPGSYNNSFTCWYLCTRNTPNTRRTRLLILTCCVLVYRYSLVAWRGLATRNSEAGSNLNGYVDFQLLLNRNWYFNFTVTSVPQKYRSTITVVGLSLIHI